MMEKNNFRFITTKHIFKNKYTYKQNATSETTVTGDCIFFFIKQIGFKKNINKISQNENVEKEIRDTILNFCYDYIAENKEASIAELYDNGLIALLYEKDLLKHISSTNKVKKVLDNKLIYMENRKYKLNNEIK